MKQHITPNQLNELSDEQKETLKSWWTPKYGDAYFYPKVNSYGHVPHGYRGWEIDDMKTRVFPLLCIGQMIEFLETKEYPTLHIDRIPVRGMREYDRYDVFQQGRGTSSEETLCDALWGAVKKVLPQAIVPNE